MKKYLLIAASAALAIAIAGAMNTPVKPKPAPDFTLPGASGKTHSLKDFKGKYVVLEWWNYGCPVVVKHYKSGNIPALQKEFKDQGVVWLSVCSSAQGKQGFVTTENAMEIMKGAGGHPTEILLDANGVTGKAYGAKTTPQIVLISPDGAMLYNGAIDDNPSATGDAILKSENYLRRAWSEVKAGKEVSKPTSQPYGCGVKYSD